MNAKPMSMWVMLGVKVKMELADLLLSKEVWLALLGVIAAVAKWQGWDIPTETFVAIEALIVAVILALKGASTGVRVVADALGFSWCD